VSPGKVAGESPAGGPSPTDPPYPSRDSMICYAEATDCCRRTKNTLRSPGHRSSGLQRLRCLQRRCLERSAGVVDHHRCCPPEPPAVSQGAAGPRHHRTPDGGDPPDGVGQRPRFRCTGGMGIGGRRGSHRVFTGHRGHAFCRCRTAKTPDCWKDDSMHPAKLDNATEGDTIRDICRISTRSVEMRSGTGTLSTKVGYPSVV